MEKVYDYNREVQNWNFDNNKTPEFLRLLTERNLYLQGKTPVTDLSQDYGKPSKNVAVIDSKSIKILEHVAFHVGFPHQEKLHGLTDKRTGYRSNNGVFFSLDPKDVVYFSEFEKFPLSMVYLLDSGLAKEVRVQTKYDSPVISRYGVDDMLNANEGRDKNHLRKEHKKLNKEWIKENTILFDIEQLKDFKEKGYDWLVVPDPIDVKY